MKTHTVGIIMNGVTGRMGTNQHLVRSILAIRAQGGIPIGPDETILPEPILVGRNAGKLKALADAQRIERFTTDLDAALGDSRYSVYFDALSTDLRAACVRKAIAAGKHIYAEKPTATTAAEALALAREATRAGVKHGVVQDKLWLPGLLKLKALIDHNFFGRILAVRGEFGYWVFDGVRQPCQRPTWNYRREDGGSLILDMFCHWRYVIDNLFGEIESLVALGATHVPRRVDEQGRARAVQFLLVRAGAAGRPADDPSGRHGGQRGGRAPRVPRATRRVHPQARLEPGHRPAHRLLRRLADGAQQRTLRQRLQGRVGAVPQARGGRRAVSLEPIGRGQGRAVGRAGPAILAGAPLGRRSGTGVIAVGYASA
jgi:predicted dehydrogenase